MAGQLISNHFPQCHTPVLVLKDLGRPQTSGSFWPHGQGPELT